VAPDHPEVKNVENDFASLFGKDDDDGTGETTTTTTLEYFGNVTVGTDVSLSELRGVYDAVVLAYGCDDDKKLGLVGEELEGVLSAREFVAWYNGHPCFVSVGDKVKSALSRRPNDDGNKVVVIGQGNVALDCARVLAKGGKGLYDTDVAAHSLPVLGDGVASVTVLGRRGHVQGAFTIKELRELVKLKKEGYDTSFLVRTDELDRGTTASSKEELRGPGSRPKTRIDKLLRDAASSCGDESGETSKEISLRFLLNPVKFLPKESDASRVGAVVCERTELRGEPFLQRAVGTGEMETFEADLVLVSIGYKGIPLTDMENEIFDHAKGVVKNDHGKVITTSSSQESTTEAALFACGWLKRGPVGIIGTNITDAKDTVESIMSHFEKRRRQHPPPRKGAHARDELATLLKNRDVHVVDWSSFQKIDDAEKRRDRRRSDSQPREKFTDVADMMRVLE